MEKGPPVMAALLSLEGNPVMAIAAIVSLLSFAMAPRLL